MSEKVCLECGVRMEVGYVPDRTHGGWAFSCWYPGKAVRETFLGIPLWGVRSPGTDGLPLVAYRCPQCGVLTFYAEKEGAE